MARIFQKSIYVVAVTRGRRTRLRYGNTLKEALALSGLKAGEDFTYMKYTGGEETDAVWKGDDVYSVAR